MWAKKANDLAIMTQAVDGLAKMAETLETKVNIDISRKKPGRGRSQSGRGRGSRANDQMRSQISASTISPLNGQLECSYHKV